jgi:hypothetical protein
VPFSEIIPLSRSEHWRVRSEHWRVERAVTAVSASLDRSGGWELPSLEASTRRCCWRSRCGPSAPKCCAARFREI